LQRARRADCRRGTLSILQPAFESDDRGRCDELQFRICYRECASPAIDRILTARAPTWLRKIPPPRIQKRVAPLTNNCNSSRNCTPCYRSSGNSCRFSNSSACPPRNQPCKSTPQESKAEASNNFS